MTQVYYQTIGGKTMTRTKLKSIARKAIILLAHYPHHKRHPLSDPVCRCTPFDEARRIRQRFGLNGTYINCGR